MRRRGPEGRQAGRKAQHPPLYGSKNYYSGRNTDTSILRRYSAEIRGTISCYDRLIVQGTLDPVGHPGGMASLLYRRHVRIFDCPRFAEWFTAKIRDHVSAVAAVDKTPIQFVRKQSLRKEVIVAALGQRRGNHPGLVCILSAMETCATFKPRHDKQTAKTFLRLISSYHRHKTGLAKHRQNNLVLFYRTLCLFFCLFLHGILFA